jgi:hypothetical protein
MNECIDLMELALRDLKSTISIFEYHKYLGIYRDMLKLSDRKEKLPQVEQDLLACDEEIKKIADRHKRSHPQ